MTNPLLQTKNLSTGYFPKKRESKVLHQSLNMDLAAGELVCVLGPNGAGKSTLLRTLLGFQKSLKGEIYYSGRSLKELSVREMAKIVSVVLTDRIDDSFLTVYEVVATGRYPYGSFTGRLKDIDKQIIQNVIQRLGIGNFVSQLFSTLSDGEKQKTMIARAIAQETPLIFLDEPAAFIDSPSKVVLMEILKKLAHDQDKGILLTTHDMEPALRFADKLWLLGTDGEFEEGEPRELIKNGSINRFFDNEEVVFNRETVRFEKSNV
ncbi:MAG: ABC transporter ATP-binding protein [Bacteroidetes bacterium]|nr:MAG: ABC transporter ATP-binding protein [Bacteroidota bacterium]